VVTAPTGAFVGGAKIGPPVAATAVNAGSAFLTVGSTAPLFSAASQEQLERLRDIATPGGRPVAFTGQAQVNRDSVGAITSLLPLVLTVIAGITFVLLFMLTGSAVSYTHLDVYKRQQQHHPTVFGVGDIGVSRDCIHATRSCGRRSPSC